MEKVLAYGSVEVGQRGCHRLGELLSSYWTHRLSGIDVVAQNHKPDQANEVSYSINGLGGGEKVSLCKL